MIHRPAAWGPPLWLALIAALALGLAYQIRPRYTITMDSPFDHLYLADGFHEQEQNAVGAYRWTTGLATVRIQGVGRQPLRLVARLASAGVDPQPGKVVQVRAADRAITDFPVSPTLTTFTVPIPSDASDPISGDLNLILTMPSFHVPGDPRELGVIVQSLAIEPVGDPRLILPPPIHLLYVILIVLGVYGLGLRIGLDVSGRRLVGLGAVGGTAALYAALRPTFALYAGNLLLAVALTLGTLLIVQPLIVRLYRRSLPGFDSQAHESRCLFGLFAAGLLIGWAGLLYPQSNPNDFLFHLHRFQEVQQGTLFFDNYVVSGVGLGFYPPAMYVLLLLPARLLPDPFYLIKLVPVLFDFSGIFVVFYLARRYFVGYPAAPLLAATLYTVLPINGLLLWWAHETNGFGLSLLILALALVPAVYKRLTQPATWLGLTALFFVLFLSHPGVLVWSLALFGVLPLVFLGLRRLTGRGSYRAVLALTTALGVAGGSAFVLYYSHYVGSFGNSAAGRGSTLVDLGTTLSRLGNPAAIANMLRLTWANGIWGDYGIWPLLLLPVGLGVLFRAQPQPLGAPGDSPATAVGQAERFRWTLLTWVAVGIAFLIVNLLTSIPIRPFLLLWPVVSLLVGLALAAWLAAAPADRRRRVAIGALLAGTAALSLYLWTSANFWDLHPPHEYPHVF